MILQLFNDKIFRNSWIDSEKNQSLENSDASYRSIAWKFRNEGIFVGETRIIFQRLITSALNVVVKYREEYFTLIGRFRIRIDLKCLKICFSKEFRRKMENCAVMRMLQKSKLGKFVKKKKIARNCIFSGGHKIKIPVQCSLTSQNLHIGALKKYHMKDQEIKRDEVNIQPFEIQKTVISKFSIQLQQQIAKEMGRILTSPT